MNVNILCGDFGPESTEFGKGSKLLVESWLIYFIANPFSFPHYLKESRFLLLGLIRCKSLVKGKKNLLLKFLSDTRVYLDPITVPHFQQLLTASCMLGT